MRLFLFFFIFIGFVAMIFRSVDKPSKINGVCLVNPPSKITSEQMGEVKRTNAQWVAVIPYAFSSVNESKISFDHSRQWWGERTEGNEMLIRYAKENNLKIMVKPHVWVKGQGWAGDFDLDTEEKWKEWEQNYSKYIMNYVRNAEAMNAEMICIGTEYRVAARKRSKFWRKLIQDIRKIYSGKITYAANWDNYKNITWWDALDYIGIDSYFPLTIGVDPSIKSIKIGWNPIKKELAKFSEKWNKQILFTEYGFQSMTGATGRHWEIEKNEKNVNLQLQANAYEATFQALENEDWWAGGFFWKWHFSNLKNDWVRHEWTPQNKPAEKIIAKWYEKLN